MLQCVFFSYYENILYINNIYIIVLNSTISMQKK